MDFTVAFTNLPVLFTALALWYVLGVIGAIYSWTQSLDLHLDMLIAILLVFWIIGPFLGLVAILPSPEPVLIMKQRAKRKARRG